MTARTYKSSIIQEMLDKISPKEKEEMHKEMEESFRYYGQLKKEGKIYCTPTSVSLDILRENGFNPIGICSYYGEETFIFNTKKEASAAYKKLEKDGKTWIGEVVGWYYGKKDFLKILETEKYKPNKIYWL